MNGLSYQNTTLQDPENKNKFLYNGKELDDEFGLNLYHYGFRLYDPQLGRFPSLDPLADEFAFVSPYNYAENSPIACIDLWGLQKYLITDKPVQPVSKSKTKVVTSQRVKMSYYQKEGGGVIDFKHPRNVKNENIAVFSKGKNGPSFSNTYPNFEKIKDKATGTELGGEVRDLKLSPEEKVTRFDADVDVITTYTTKTTSKFTEKDSYTFAVTDESINDCKTNAVKTAVEGGYSIEIQTNNQSLIKEFKKSGVNVYKQLPGVLKGNNNAIIKYGNVNYKTTNNKPKVEIKKHEE